MIILLVLFYLLFPVVLIYLVHKNPIFSKIGVVLLAYTVGLIIGNIGILPEGSEQYNALLNGRVRLPVKEVAAMVADGKLPEGDLYVNQIYSTQDVIMTIVIPLAIILLILSLNVKRWLRLAKTTFISLILALISVLSMVILGFFLFKNDIPDIWKVGGMLIGVYSGGTPNLASIQAALNVDPSIFILTHTYDMLLCAILLLFLISFGQPVFNLILPKFNIKTGTKTDEMALKEVKELDNFKPLIQPENFKSIGVVVGLSIVIFGIGGGISFLVPESMAMAVVILTITTLAVLASFIPAINRIKVSYQLGMYLIIIFSLVVASMGNLTYMFNIDFIHLFLYVALTVFGSLILHVLLSIPFRIDTDTMIISSTALIYSPPFVPVVAGALKNKEIILSGIAIGVIGYVVGNYLGIFTGYFLQSML